MNSVITGALALLAVGVGYTAWGWQGLILAATLIAFWLILQFNRALRVLRKAADAPLGRIANAVMFNARLRRGLTLAEVIGLSKSLGHKTHESPETYEWVDGGGDTVEVVLKQGRCATWTLKRSAG